MGVVPLAPWQDALVEVGQWLRRARYQFVTVTPETHRRQLARRTVLRARSIEDVFGWSLPFAPTLLPRELLLLLEEAGVLERVEGILRSRVRFSTLEGGLYAHSAFPTTAADSVFFGPDTYRFCRFICARLSRCPVRALARVVDVGCGSGVGGISCLSLVPSASVSLLDISPRALAFAAINARIAGVQVELIESDVLRRFSGDADLILCNPPYMADPQKRAYRDGGGQLGTELSLRILRESLPRLSQEGHLLMYSGAPVCDGVDALRQSVFALAAAHQMTCVYDEIDPDVFSDELDSPAYAGADRIAAVGIHFHSRSPS